MKTKGIKIREYGRTELAQVYAPAVSPERAWRKLRDWIDNCPGLPEKLKALGYRPSKQRTFTPGQVRAILAALGEP